MPFFYLVEKNKKSSREQVKKKQPAPELQAIASIEEKKKQLKEIINRPNGSKESRKSRNSGKIAPKQAPPGQIPHAKEEAKAAMFFANGGQSSIKSKDKIQIELP